MIAFLMICSLGFGRQARVLDVGDRHAFVRISDAVEAARPGDVIEVHPRNVSYSSEAVIVAKPNLTIRGVGRSPVLIDGGGYDYSGVGRTPRAIFQIDPSGAGASIVNFELRNAHNGSHNGAGVRINGASNVTVRSCDINGNDMGIMSGGIAGDLHSAENQLVDRCVIHENGSFTDPGYNHNLYLGGTSATLNRCDIYGALTGHNVKSRAHFLMVRYCHVHGGNNRQFDLVDAWDTERPNSNAVLIGNLIEPDPTATGNRTVIHFGHEKGHRNGTLFLINDTIITPFVSPVAAMDSPDCSAEIDDCLIFSHGQAAPVLAEGAVHGTADWISAAYHLEAFQLANVIRGGAPGFRSGLPVVPVQPESWRPVRGRYIDGNGRTVRLGLPERLATDGSWYSSRTPFVGVG